MTRRLGRLLRRNLLWSVAVYAEDAGFEPGDRFRSEPFVLDAGLRGPGDPVHTRADPFLFARGPDLYLFLEAQSTGRPGHIEAYRTRDLIDWSPLGPVLTEPHHLSYPHVFAVGSEIYMIPESVAAGQVALYRFNDFPRAPRKVRTLLAGDYVDASPARVDGVWYVFATSARGLEIFMTDDLVAGALHPHPANPVTNDVRYNRCGGVPLMRGGRLHRLAQDCSTRYGGNLNLMAIEALTPLAYAETPAIEGVFACDERWNAAGGHHMHAVSFAGRAVVAVDGQQFEPYSKKLGKLAPRLLRRG